jgi:excinuclease ABC subunit B
VGVKARYMHSDITTLERAEILRDLRLGVFDVLVGINLLREGLDLPEVSLVAVLDADKEGFLRSETSLIQVCGRASRNLRGKVILYADHITDSMERATSEMARRRSIQRKFNEEHGITPQTVHREIRDTVGKVYADRDFVELTTLTEERDHLPGDRISLLERREDLERRMHEAARELRFEEAARLRDEMRRAEALLLRGAESRDEEEAAK